MLVRLTFLGTLLLLAACASAPHAPSTVPASPEQFARAQKAVRACAKYPDFEAVLDSFEDQGFERVNVREIAPRGTGPDFDVISYSGADLALSIYPGQCIIGLKSMTPEQSYELVQPWVAQFHAVTNASLGQGLADNAVEAWRSVRSSREVYIAAYKSWGNSHSATFPDAPGASVRLIYQK